MEYTSKFFSVPETDEFHARDFPDAVNELTALRVRTRHLPAAGNDVVILSYLKDHSIRADLTHSHAPFIESLTSKRAALQHLEDLFAACKDHHRFLSSLEAYVRAQFRTTADEASITAPADLRPTEIRSV